MKNMGKKAGSPKKRNKKYSGSDAKRTGNVMRVRRVNARVQSDFALWFRDHKNLITFAIVAGISIVLIATGIYTLFK